jgi:predicted enzyme related to lactoylglutathione lyase
MAKVVGVGGVFFKSSDPEMLGAWYRKWLGVPVEPPYGASFRPDTVNLMVDDLDGALAQVGEGGDEIVGEVMEEDYGRFGWFVDPEGNKVELWEPKEGL